MLSTSASSGSYRQKGKLPSANSKLYKGFVHDATSKLSVGSIPAKLELIIYRDQSTKAFGRSEPRFKEPVNDAPGPQDYDTQSTISQYKSESVSKKGLGGLAASQERHVFQQKYVNNGPGPGQYIKENSVISTSTQPSFFMKNPTPIDRVQVIQPGPGEYELMKEKKAAIKSVFISKTLKGQYMKKPDYPAPGQYEVIKQQIPTEAPTSSFYPDSQSLKEKTAQQQIISILVSEQNLKEVSPGPGDYQLGFPTFHPDYIQNKELSSFVKQAKERFPDIKQDQIGPGQYQAQSSFDQIASEKVFVSGSVFMSECKRQPFGDFESRLGPNTKIPYVLPKKKNFHLNLQREWI